MNQEQMVERKAVRAGEDDVRELELSDEDILDAMRHIPGYLDISTQDFRAIYHLAHGHALERLFRHVSAGSLMRTGIVPLHPDTRLDAAALVVATAITAMYLTRTLHPPGGATALIAVIGSHQIHDLGSVVPS